MDRRRQPAMRAGGGSTRDSYGSDPDARNQHASDPYASDPYGHERYADATGFRGFFRRASALTRWIILVVLVGLGTAALVAVGVAALVTLLESSV
jgi:hypothetical protein